MEFVHAEQILSAPLNNTALEQLLELARSQLLWVTGSNRDLQARVSYQLGDERLDALFQCDDSINVALFEEQMRFIVQTIAKLLSKTKPRPSISKRMRRSATHVTPWITRKKFSPMYLRISA
jgi:hypothetical protein